jgi:hypothetical protein
MVRLVGFPGLVASGCGEVVLRLKFVEIACGFVEGKMDYLYYRRSMDCLTSPLSVLNPIAASASFCV